MASTNICINTLIPLSVGFHLGRERVVKGELLCSAHLQAVHQAGINPARPYWGGQEKYQVGR